MNWTEERVALLKRMWREGQSASQIAVALGGVSRNAVIGKVHRLQLSKRGRVVSAPARQKKPKLEAKKTVKVSKTNAQKAQALATTTPVVTQEYVRPVLPEVIVPISRRLKLAELTERTCKWPNGDPLHEDFAFCGNEADTKSPYCRYHARLAFQPVSQRRRSR